MSSASNPSALSSGDGYLVARSTSPTGWEARPAVQGTRGAAVELTRRGRLVLFLAVLVVTGALGVLVGGPALSTDAPHHAVTRTVVVQPGQTLWEIARKTAPEKDPRVVIAEIVDLNSLSSSGAIRAGQPLYIPAR